LIEQRKTKEKKLQANNIEHRRQRRRRRRLR